MARIELQCVLVARDRILRPVELDQHVAEISPEIRVIRFELHGLVKDLERFLAPPLG